LTSCDEVAHFASDRLVGCRTLLKRVENDRHPVRRDRELDIWPARRDSLNDFVGDGKFLDQGA
jgi:hypothetical protein